MIPLAPLAGLLLGWAGDAPAAIHPPAAFEALGADAVQDLVILGETRPILLRVRIMVGDRSPRAAQGQLVREIHHQLDGDGDGKLTVAEADSHGLALFLPPPSPTRPRGEVDAAPKDGTISVEELARSLGAADGALRVQADGLTDRRTDALFDLLDRDQDGQLTRPEQATIIGTLRKLDRDDNELISVEEVATAGTPAAAPATSGRPQRDLGTPSVIAVAPGESPLRLIRVLLKKYDMGSSQGAGKPDSRLTPEEFAISAAGFARADANGDNALTSDELRKYYASSPVDAIVDLTFSATASGQAAARVLVVEASPPAGLLVRQFAPDLVELDCGAIRLDLRVDDGAGAIGAARRTARARFLAADANKDDYLEAAELTQEDGQPSPLADLFAAIDLNHDGKLYQEELDQAVDRQATAARTRLALNASNQGRALFGLLDLDRDRQLGAREVLDTSARILTCDRNGDGRIDPGEIPHHIQLTFARGDLTNLSSASLTRPLAGPDWFRRMDRNHDGDVSRREFLGTPEQYDRLDRDGDGLLAPAEAEAARPAVKGPGG